MSGSDEERHLSRRGFFGAIGGVFAAVMGGCLSNNTEPADPDEHPEAVAMIDDATVYNSPGCGCCDEYVDYLSKSVGFDVEVGDRDVDDVRREAGVPVEAESCHTLVAEGYFVEGHVPIEAIDKLAAERPTIRGIALPGMPAGSPGMGGEKRDSFEILSVSEDGELDVFVEL